MTVATLNTYTDSYTDLDSSFVTDVFYNKDTKTTWVGLESWLGTSVYQYENVPADVITSLVEADSIGAFYNTKFKPVYGPAKDLGNFYPQDFTKAEPSNVVHGNFTPTKEYSLGFDHGAFDSTVSGAPRVSDATPEFSLAALPEPEVDNSGPINLTTTVTVHYVLNGKKAKFSATNYDSVQDVLDEFGEVLVRLGLTADDVTPTKVVYKFSE